MTSKPQYHIINDRISSMTVRGLRRDFSALYRLSTPADVFIRGTFIDPLDESGESTLTFDQATLVGHVGTRYLQVPMADRKQPVDVDPTMDFGGTGIIIVAPHGIPSSKIEHDLFEPTNVVDALEALPPTLVGVHQAVTHGVFDGGKFPSMKVIAQTSGVDPKAVRYYLDLLVECNLIKRDETGNYTC